MPTDHQQTFRRRLEAFVLFHLGMDARLDFEADPAGGVTVRLRHSRIRDLNFELDAPELAAMSRSREATEDFLLDQLTAHRRGGLAR